MDKGIYRKMFTIIRMEQDRSEQCRCKDKDMEVSFDKMTILYIGIIKMEPHKSTLSSTGLKS